MPSQLIFTTGGSAPATPGSGTVSVYSKTSDKRLYYKDDTGTEVGPLEAGGSGTVTSVSVTTANGVSGSVADATTTPAISITLGAITPTSVNGNTLASGSGTKTFPAGSVNIGYLEIPQNSQSAAYTTVLADSGKHIFHPSADTTARIWTIDSNANVAYPIGTAITFINQNSGGVITIAITSDTMRLAGAGTTGSRTLAANGIATAIKVTSTEWIISGTGLS